MANKSKAGRKPYWPDEELSRLNIRLPTVAHNAIPRPKVAYIRLALLRQMREDGLLSPRIEKALKDHTE